MNYGLKIYHQGNKFALEVLKRKLCSKSHFIFDYFRIVFVGFLLIYFVYYRFFHVYDDSLNVNNIIFL